MLSKAVIIFACLYTVTATPLTDNPHEDDTNEINNISGDPVELSVRSCVNSQCNTFCRRQGFARGVCISSTRCRCTGRLMLDANLDDVTLEKDNPSDNGALDAQTLDTYARSCVNSQCHNLCRRLGYARGVCVSSTVCRCTGRLVMDATVDDIALEKDNPSDNGALDAQTLDTYARSCVNSQCHNLCRRLGYARGVCISSTVCRCTGRLVMDATVDDITLEKDNPSDNGALDAQTLDTYARSCVNSQCHNLCRRLGYARGVCVSSTVCRCTGRLMLDATVNDSVPEYVIQGRRLLPHKRLGARTAKSDKAVKFKY
ncbi:unnamed protein product [Diatraea saccharalis]|uniref:Knottins-like domain-containing protein n=1 Tax=Diatraea saccharalis TaxID=40085 RepID=A0A9N9WGE8_9NEOP|nr:unnamed protein product [Diatraea saccharalis]